MNERAQVELTGETLHDRKEGALFTAAQIAASLAVTPRAVRKAMQNTPPSGARVVGGNETATWSLSQLPETMRRKLRERATVLRYRDEQAMLEAPAKLWQPPIPLADVCEQDLGVAMKLRDALRPMLLTQHSDGISAAAFEEQGVAEYARQFGHRITRRYWREIFKRTVERDRGQENWGRLEIYLPERVAAKTEQGKGQPGRPGLFPDLVAYIDACKRPATEMEERGIWSLVFEEYSKVAPGLQQKRLGRDLRALLLEKSPFGQTTQEAILKAFQRKLIKWQQGGGKSLVDGRKENGGDDFEFPQEDLDIISAKVAFHYGEYAPAWREALEKGELSELTRLRYGHCPARKSYVPAKLVNTLGEMPRYLYVLHRRKNDFNNMKASFTSNYEGLRSLSVISADDVTLPVYFYYQAEEAEPMVTRGQCLVFIDLVSKRILGWSLQPERNYNALVIYTQTARVLAEKGIPRALLFERGIWERAKILAGTAPFSFTEVTQGLREFGIQIFHAKSARGKHETEKVMGLVQNLMEGEPGYCGRDERRDRPDWVHKQLLALESKSRPEHPSKFFYSFEQWNARLSEIFERYNSTRQDGSHMQGRSPDKVYVENWDESDPPTKLGPELRYMFAHAKYERIVTPAGVTITNGKRQFKYFGPELQDLVGFRVLVWFDPEFPEEAIVTDLKRSNPIAVSLEPEVPRLEQLTNPDGTRLAEACARREGQIAGIKARYNTLRDKFEVPYRRNLVAAKTITLGQEIAQQRHALSGEKQAAERRRRATLDSARQLGLDPSILSDGPESDEGIALMRAAMRAHKLKEESV